MRAFGSHLNCFCLFLPVRWLAARHVRCAPSLYITASSRKFANTISRYIWKRVTVWWGKGRGRGWRLRLPRQSRRRCCRRRCSRATSARRRSTPRFCRPERARKPVLARTHACCACAEWLRETRTTVQAASAVASEAASFYPVPPELEYANDVPLLYNSTVPEVACVLSPVV